MPFFLHITLFIRPLLINCVLLSTRNKNNIYSPAKVLLGVPSPVCLISVAISTTMNT
jgi:hypothetical protein